MVWTPWNRPAAAAAPSTPSRAAAAFSSLAGAAASLTFGKQQPVGYESDAALASQLQAQEDSAVEGLVADIYSDDGGGKDPVAAAASRKNDRELGILSDEEIMDNTVDPNVEF